MAGGFVETRRVFLKGVGAAGIALIVRNFSTMVRAAAGHDAWMGGPGKARYRVDGIAKVRGEKVYARDFRAADMAGWPRKERGALVLRACHVDRKFRGLDLSPLDRVGVTPRRVVLAKDLEADDVAASAFQQPPAGRPDGLFTAADDFPVYYGQPLALLIFEDPRATRVARNIVRSDRSLVRYGDRESIEPAGAPYGPTTYVTLYRDESGERFSQAKNGRGNPYAENPSEAGRLARQWREQIERNMADTECRLFEASYETQALDPVFLEPEAGLAWLDRKRTGATLHLVLGTQSGSDDVLLAKGLFDTGKIKTVVLNACFPGGGFGGRVGSPFTALLAIAAFYCDGPVRLAYDRFEQFQAGLKQLGSNISHRIAVDGMGKFRAATSKILLQAGGNNNVSGWVAQFSGYSALGGYSVGQAAIDAVAVPSPGVVAGSMRGFGGVQAVFAIESMVEEIAQDLEIDPIALRRCNVLRSGEATITGAMPALPLRLPEICDLAAERALWRERDREKQQRNNNAKLYGVGFALANQAFGTGADGVMAEVSVSRVGEISVRTNCIDMGNGSATALALCTAASLGGNASAVRMGDTTKLVAALGLDSETTSSHHWSEPRWTAVLSGASSACVTAFHQAHAVQQAALVLFHGGILPAAFSLWGIAGGAELGRFGSPSPQRDGLRWEDGRLAYAERPTLTRADIAREIYRRNLVSGVAAHAVHIGAWVSAEFEVDGQLLRLDSDGVSTRLANRANWRRHPRLNPVAPDHDAFLLGRNLFAPSGALAAVEVDRATGAICVVEVESFVDAGRIIQPDLVAGQSDGGVAMGIGFALQENASGGDDGPGSGRWNLDRYQVPVADDVPIRNMKLTLLGGDDDTPKGIAEAVLCPIPAAIANAVAHAIGYRPRALPITAEWVRKVLG